jgi:CrcB protein
MIRNLLLVGLGGGLGSILRYLTSRGLMRYWPGDLPLGTLTVNVLGCLTIGLLSGLMISRQALTPEFRLFFMVGILGGFTTFSTFGYESVQLMLDGQFNLVFLNVILNVGLGLTACWLGLNLTRTI